MEPDEGAGPPQVLPYGRPNPPPPLSAGGCGQALVAILALLAGFYVLLGGIAVGREALQIGYGLPGYVRGTRESIELLLLGLVLMYAAGRALKLSWRRRG